MEEVNVTTCCMFYPLNEMTEHQLSAVMPYLLFQFDHIGIIAVERFIHNL